MMKRTIRSFFMLRITMPRYQVFTEAAAQRLDATIPSTRNIGIVAHIDAGKTTTTERMLFYAGETKKIGEVDSGTTTTDFMEEEAKRGITIQSAAVSLSWDNHRINVIDTPGHVDFTLEVERSLRVCDGVVALFDASAGVQAQSYTVLRQARKFQTPVVAFLNKMDKMNANYKKSIESIRSKLNLTPLPLQVPLQGQDGEFNGVIDLVTMESVHFVGNRGGEVKAAELTEMERDSAIEARHELLTELSARDDDIAEALIMALDETDGDEAAAELKVPAALIRKAVRAHTIQQGLSGVDATEGPETNIGHSRHTPLVPILCGASRRDQGVQPLLDAINQYLPSPRDRPQLKGYSQEGSELDLPPPTSAHASPSLALVFKITFTLNKKSGKIEPLAFLRVYSGRLAKGMKFQNQRTSSVEVIEKVYVMHANEHREVDVLGAGSIGAVFLKETGTGDTLFAEPVGIGAAAKKNLLKNAANASKTVRSLEGISIPPPAISYAIEAPNANSVAFLDEALKNYQKEDPSFRYTQNEHGQMIVSGMGELHVEIILNRIKSEYQLSTKLTRAIIEYRETMKEPIAMTSVIGAHTSTGSKLFEVDFTVVPLMDAAEGTCPIGSGNTGGKPVFVDASVDARDRFVAAGNGNKEKEMILRAQFDDMLRMVEGAMKEVTRSGPLAALPMVGIQVRIDNYSQLVPHIEDRHGAPVWRKLIFDTLRNPEHRAEAVLLEPMMHVEVHLIDAEKHLGDVVKSLNEKNAISVDLQEDGKSVFAKVAMRNITKYAMELRKAAKGSAHYWTTLDHYRVVESGTARTKILSNLGVEA